MNWNEIWSKFLNWCTTTGWNITEGILALILGIIVSKILIGIIKKIFSKSKIDKVAKRFIVNFIAFVLYLMVGYIVASVWKIPMTGFIAIVSAAGLAVSLALQGSLSNLANGIVLIITKPFKEGDYVQINSVEGSVKEIKMLYTVLTTLDNKTITIPNKTVVDSNMTNYTANPTRKVVHTFNVSYTTDLEKVKGIINSVIINNEMVLLEPTPSIILSSLDENSIKILASCWCNNQDFGKVYSDILDDVFNEFKREGIEIPFKQMEVRLKNEKEILPYRESVLEDKTEMKKKKQELAKQRKKELQDSKFEILPGIVIPKPRRTKSKIKKEINNVKN